MDFAPFVKPLTPIRAVTQSGRRCVRQLSVVLAIAVALAFWLKAGATSMTQTSPLDPSQQNSPIASPTPDPFATPTPDPFAAPTVDPFATPTSDPFATATPDPFATATPDPFATPTVDPFATATVDPNIAPDAAATSDTSPTPDTAPTPLLLLPPVDRAIVPPPAAEPLAFAAIIDDVLSSMADVAVWLWFVCGSLIFFVVAGVIGGIYFSQRERQRYDLYTLEPDEHAHFEFEDRPERRTRPPDDDVWPASLP